MLVVAQYASQTFAPHGLHGNTVGEAVALVGTAGVKIEPGLERLARLRNNVNSPVSGEALHRCNCPLAQPAISGKKRQELR